MATSVPFVNSASIEFLEKSYGKTIEKSDNGIKLSVGNGRNVSGVLNIAKYFQRTSNEFKGVSLEERMLVEQWLEYQAFLKSSDTEVALKELNQYLQDKVYLVGQRWTLADVLLYHSLHSIFTNLSFQDKEKWIHLSRWFNHIQQDQRTRQSLASLVFVRSPLYSSSHSH